MNKIILTVAIYCLLSSSQAIAQTQYKALKPLKIGDQVPESLWKSLPINKGSELVILDFWNTHCGTCIESFPKMEKLQKQFSPKLTVILVNVEEDATTIKERFAVINKGKIYFEVPPVVWPDLKIMNGNNFLNYLFPRRSVPHHVWLSGSGVVRAITADYNATPKHVAQTLEGKKLELYYKDDISYQNSHKNGFLIPSVTTSSPFYYSCFTTSRNGTSYSNAEDTLKGTFRKSTRGDVISLLRFAFSNDSLDNRIVVEAHNPEQYKRPKDGNLIDDWDNKYEFTYEMQGLMKDKAKWLEAMKEDANQFFRSKFGIEAVVETKTFNCLILKSDSGSIKPSAGGREWMKITDSSYVLRNTPFQSVSSFVRWYFEDMNAGLPVVDETGINEYYKVDFILKGDLKNLENVNRQLRNYGLEIVKGKREMKVLVIRDK